MGKRTFDAAVEDLLKIHDHENHDVKFGDIVEADVAKCLASEIRRLEADYLSFVKRNKQKRMGRHSLNETRYNDQLRRKLCYEWAEELRKDPQIRTLNAAFEKLTKQKIVGVSLGKRTIRNYYYEVRPKRTSARQSASKAR